MNPGMPARGLRRRVRAGVGPAVLVAMAGLCAAAAARAVLPAETGAAKTVETLPTPPSRHWVWVNDLVFPHMADGTAHLVDGDSGRYLGMLSTGASFSHVVPSRDGKLIYSPEIYFSRGTRGTRTDVVTVYDAATLRPVTEVPVPPKRASSVPALGVAGLTDDDRFLMIYNFTPAQSVSVVDTASRQFVGEVETPGCAFALPTGPRSCFAMCAGASFLAVELDESGHALRQSRTEPMFDGSRDPVFERPVRMADTYYFVSFDGTVHPIRHSGAGFAALDTWPLASAAERAQGWRPGGVQQIAVHAGSRRLYVLMHRGGRDSHKDPGRAIWVYDLGTRRRVQQIALPHPLTSIALSTDDQPLLFGLVAEGNVLDVFAPGSGKLLRSIKDVGTTPVLLVTP